MLITPQVAHRANAPAPANPKPADTAPAADAPPAEPPKDEISLGQKVTRTAFGLVGAAAGGIVGAAKGGLLEAGSGKTKFPSSVIKFSRIAGAAAGLAGGIFVGLSTLPVSLPLALVAGPIIGAAAIATTMKLAPNTTSTRASGSVMPTRTPPVAPGM